ADVNSPFRRRPHRLVMIRYLDIVIWSLTILLHVLRAASGWWSDKRGCYRRERHGAATRNRRGLAGFLAGIVPLCSGARSARRRRSPRLGRADQGVDRYRPIPVAGVRRVFVHERRRRADRHLRVPSRPIDRRRMAAAGEPPPI